MFLLANAVDDADHGHHPRRAGRGPHQRHARRCCCSARRSASTAIPIFAHLPLIVNEQRQKLSKRRDDVSVGDYIDRGYLPEAMVNYLATLGWGAPDGVEIRPLPEIVELFRLEDVNASGAFFDLKKLAALQRRVHPRSSRSTSSSSASSRWLHRADAPWPAERFDVATFAAIAPLVQERVKRLDEVPGYVDFLFLPDAPDRRRRSWEKVMRARTPTAAVRARRTPSTRFADVRVDAAAIEDAALRLRATSTAQPSGKAQAPVRVAVTGRTVGPPAVRVARASSAATTTLRRDRAPPRSALTPWPCTPADPCCDWVLTHRRGPARPARRALRRASPSPRCGGRRARTTGPHARAPSW